MWPPHNCRVVFLQAFAIRSRTLSSRLASISQRLQALAYTQTTIAWEAPLDGSVSIAGQFTAGFWKPDRDELGGLDPNFGPQEFEALYDKVSKYQDDYIDRRSKCELWSWDAPCHDVVSDPFGSHYAPQKAEIKFIRTPRARAQVSLFRRLDKKVVVCTDIPQNEAGFDLGTLQFGKDCQPSGENKGQLIRVKAGDVLYVTYNIHPHYNKWLKPRATISYAQVDDDPAFRLFKAGDPNKVIAGLSCKWKDETT